MEFFNKKEDVIDLQLTQFGRHLLSRGKFKPVFYSFFDDNILYDSTKAGISEEQNETEERIREAQTAQPQISFSSLEKEFNTNYEKILTSQAKPQSVVQQKTAEKNYAIPAPLGTSDINSEYVPSWSIRYLNGSITGSSGHLELQEKSGGKNVIKVPQLYTDTTIKVKQLDPGDPDETSELMDAPSNASAVVVSNEKDHFVLLKVIENNGFFQKKNFDIEIFEVIEEKQDNATIEVLRPLYFFQPFDIEKETDPVEQVTPEDDQDYVAHYLDLRIDDEINPKMLCEYDPQNVKLGVFSDDRATLCQDVLNQQEKTSFNIYEEGTEDIPGDIC